METIGKRPTAVPSDSIRLEFIDKLYAVAMEPERFTELVDIWHQQLADVSEEGAQAFSEDMRLMEAHIRRAETLFSMVTSNEALLPASLVERLHSEPQPALVIDRQGVIVGLNPAAVQTLGVSEQADCSSLDLDADTLGVLQEHVERVLVGDESATAEPVLVRGWKHASGEAVVLSLTPLTTAGGRRLLAVRVVDFAWPDRLTPVVQEAFGLTRAEATVMKLLAQGNSAAQIADIRRASIATVRSQIRAIYSKTATRNQSEFLRMALGLAAVESVGKSAVPGRFDVAREALDPPHPREEERHLHRLADGRVLEYADFGDPEGAPCVHFHNEFFGDAMAADTVRDAARSGLRIITPVRPHNGRSSPYPRDRATHDQFARDCAELLDALGIDRVVHLSFMVGTAFSLGFAALYPERTAGMVIIAPTFPFQAPGVQQALPYFHRVLAGILNSSNWVLEFMCRSGMAFQNRAGTRQFFEAFAKSRPQDLALVRDDERFLVMEHGARLCAAQGHQGFYQDYRERLEDPWSLLMKIESPVCVLIGEHCRSSTAESFRLLARERSNVSTCVAPGGAHYVLYSHARQVVELLSAVWQETCEVSSNAVCQQTER